MFKMGGRINIHDEKWSVWPVVESDDRVQSERRRIKISEL
jgi:hypothetical protein